MKSVSFVSNSGLEQSIELWFKYDVDTSHQGFDNLALSIGHYPIGIKILKVVRRFALVGGGFSYDMRVNGETSLVRQVMNFAQSWESFIAFDVGAHLGKWSDLVRQQRVLNSPLYLFEPPPPLFRGLNIRYANFPNMHLSRLALADTVGSTKFLQYSDSGSTVNSLIISYDLYATGQGPGTLIDVQVSTGDFFCTENRIPCIDFMKVDVEDGEMLVLRGFEEMIAEQKIDIVQFEYGHASEDAGHLMKDFYQFWERYGYSVGVLRNQGVEFQSFSCPLNNFQSGPNFVPALPKFVSLLQSFG